MIRLSRLTDYAVALLFHMGTAGKDALWTATSLSERSGLPMPTVAKVLKLLSKRELVVAVRGASGGYKLARPHTTISIATIIEAMDGPIAITDCAEGSEHAGCKIESLCPMTAGWNKVNRAIRGALENISLADISTPFSVPPAPAAHAVGE
jgi:FeS assembly SUF system regulator